MTERDDLTDEELGAADLAAVRALLAEAPSLAPSAQLDASILAAAQAAAGAPASAAPASAAAGPDSGSVVTPDVPAWRRVAPPLAAAASVVLVVSLAWQPGMDMDDVADLGLEPATLPAAKVAPAAPDLGGAGERDSREELRVVADSDAESAAGAGTPAAAAEAAAAPAATQIDEAVAVTAPRAAAPQRFTDASTAGVQQAAPRALRGATRGRGDAAPLDLLQVELGAALAGPPPTPPDQLRLRLAGPVLLLAATPGRILYVNFDPGGAVQAQTAADGLARVPLPAALATDMAAGHVGRVTFSVGAPPQADAALAALPSVAPATRNGVLRWRDPPASTAGVAEVVALYQAGLLGAALQAAETALQQDAQDLAALQVAYLVHHRLGNARGAAAYRQRLPSAAAR